MILDHPKLQSLRLSWQQQYNKARRIRDYILPRITLYATEMPQLFDPETEQGKALTEQILQLMERGDTGLLEEQLKLLEPYVRNEMSRRGLKRQPTKLNPRSL